MKVIRGVAMAVLVAMMSFLFVFYVDADEPASVATTPVDHTLTPPASR